MKIASDQSQSETNVNEIISLVKTYLADAEIKYHDIAEDAVEMYMQGKNLTMHIVIYVHNSHLIFRIPGFIRNVELRRADVTHFLMQVMGDILDIRFELGKEGNSLSACCQHILEDASITRRQFDLAIMVLIHIVDDTYPHLMKLIYNVDSDEMPEQDSSGVDFADEQIKEGVTIEDDIDENDEFAPIANNEEPRKIN